MLTVLVYLPMILVNYFNNSTNQLYLSVCLLLMLLLFLDTFIDCRCKHFIIFADIFYKKDMN